MNVAYKDKLFVHDTYSYLCCLPHFNVSAFEENSRTSSYEHYSRLRALHLNVHNLLLVTITIITVTGRGECASKQKCYSC